MNQSIAHRLAALATAFLGTACAGSGLGGTVRSDVSTQMESAQADLAACYHKALREKRKLRGRMVVGFDAAPATGQFQNVRVVDDPLGNEGLARCVTDRISTLKLATPQKTTVSIDSFPLEFEPTE